MKLAWLEDFLSLIELGTFSAAAERRNVTQPAFSRRIRMLEDWLGVSLVDRSGHRFAPTATATRFEPEIRALVARNYDLRSCMRADTLADRRLAVTMQHTLMVTHLPGWLRRFQEWEPHTAFHVHTGNVEECIQQLIRGGADLMIAYEAQRVDAGYTMSLADAERRALDAEALVPVVAARSDGARPPLIDGAALGILNYPDQSFLGRVVRSHCLPTVVRRFNIEIVCESAFAVGLKEMCLAGLGIAWLPKGVVARELATGTLHSLADELVAPSLDIVARRLRNNPNRALADLWERLDAES